MATSSHSKETENTSVIKAATEGYNYNYASLADIANHIGKPLPKMRISLVQGIQFVEYKDDDGEWQQGAEVVVPKMAGSNDAQIYGAALSYARRYTALLALGLACLDDQKLEKSEKNKSFESGHQSTDRPPTDKQLEYLLKLLTTAGQEVTMEELKSKIKTASMASATIEKYKNGAE